MNISCLAWWCQWCVCLYTHQCVRAACAYYMYAFVSSPDHSLWPGELPGEASGIYLSLPEYHGVWCRQHPLPEGGVWRVSPNKGLRNKQIHTVNASLFFRFSNNLKFNKILTLFFAQIEPNKSKRLFLVCFTSVLMVLHVVYVCLYVQLGRIWAL